MVEMLKVWRRIKEDGTILQVQVSVVAEVIAQNRKTNQKEAMLLLQAATEEQPIETEKSAFWPVRNIAPQQPHPIAPFPPTRSALKACYGKSPWGIPTLQEIRSCV